MISPLFLMVWILAGLAGFGILFLTYGINAGFFDPIKIYENWWKAGAWVKMVTFPWMVYLGLALILSLGCLLVLGVIALCASPFVLVPALLSSGGRRTGSQKEDALNG